MFSDIVSEHTKEALYIISCAGSRMLQRDAVPDAILSSPFPRLDVCYDWIQCFSSESSDVAHTSIEKHET